MHLHQFAKTSNARIIWLISVPPTFAPPRPAADFQGIVSTSGHCHLGVSIDIFFLHVLQPEQSDDVELFGKLRAFLFVGRNNMPDVDAPTQNTQYLNATENHSTARELQKVFSLSSPSFYRCALRILGNSADAEDAVQEALLAAHKHLHQFRGQSQLSTWLTTIVCNCARMQLRKRPRQFHMPLDQQIGEEQAYFISERLADPKPSPEDDCRNSELAAHLRTGTAMLSPSLRRTFQLRVADGLSIFETAQVLGVPQGTVKAQLARARTKPARYMQRALESRSRGPQRPRTEPAVRGK
jgi:RNA polymerase sigma-70 factor (ECF subfamily)